jgi:hypothetical protein
MALPARQTISRRAVVCQMEAETRVRPGRKNLVSAALLQTLGLDPRLCARL